ncbi:MAG: M1 family aminopeptidase [Chitinophagales bacterium]
MKRLQLSLLLVCFFSLQLVQAETPHTCVTTKQQSQHLKPVASAGQRAMEDGYDVKFHHLNLNVERNTLFLSGSVRTIAKVVSSQLDSFAFELHQSMTIDSIVSGGSILGFTRSSGDVKAKLPSTKNQNEIIDLTIYYHGTPTGASAIGDGFNSSTSPSWGNEATWSLSQPYSAYNWWPCKQSLQDKIDSSRCYITTDSSNKAGSNGRLENVVNLPNGKKRFEWVSHHPIDYYLISVAVSKYVEKNSWAHLENGDSVFIQNYIYNNPATYTTFKNVIDSIPYMVELFSKLYGPYPFADEKYGHCMAPLSGGMEHQTMTTQGFFDFGVTAHELGHQWFGDHVTCASWKDIFVNEGMASYSEYLAFQYLKSYSAAQASMATVHSDVMSQPGGSIYFTDTNENRIFDSRLSYNKGSAMVHMIRFELNNDSLFFQFFKNYQNEFGNGTASGEDYKHILETTSGKSFETFFNQWYYGEGYPTFSIRYNYVNGALQMKVTQTASMPGVTPIFVTPVEYLVHRSGAADTVLRLQQTDSVNYFSMPMTAAGITGIVIDPLNWILNKTGSIGRDTLLTAIGMNETEVLQLFPNPANAFIHLPYQLNDIHVYDVLGMEHIVAVSNQMIVTENLPEGAYMLSGVLQNKRVVARFIVRR